MFIPIPLLIFFFLLFCWPEAIEIAIHGACLLFFIFLLSLPLIGLALYVF